MGVEVKDGIRTRERERAGEEKKSLVGCFDDISTAIDIRSEILICFIFPLLLPSIFINLYIYCFYLLFYTKMYSYITYTDKAIYIPIM